MSVQGGEQLSKALKDLGAGLDGAINKAIVRTANQVRGEAIKMISREISKGQVYTHHFTAMLPNGALIEGDKRSKPHTASAEGDAPNTDTGRLVSSIAVENKRRGTSFVGTSVEYGKYLEFGTSKMAARPWLRPAMERNQAKLTESITNAIKESISNVRGGK